MSAAEDMLAWQTAQMALPAPEREYRFSSSRRWRFDLAWPVYRVAVEVEGGGYIGGRHTTGLGMERDCEKYSSAVANGWRVLRVTPRQVQDGQALTWLIATLAHATP